MYVKKNIGKALKVISFLLSKTITYVTVTERKLLIKLPTIKKSDTSLWIKKEPGNLNAGYPHNT